MFPNIKMVGTTKAIVNEKRPREQRKSTESLEIHQVSPSIRSDEEAWGCLADLYQEIGKGDWLRIIREDHITRCLKSKEALLAMQSRRPNKALKIYEELLVAYEESRIQGTEILPGILDVSNGEANIWYEDKMECLEKLGYWDVLQEQVGVFPGNILHLNRNLCVIPCVIFCICLQSWMTSILRIEQALLCH